MLKNNIWKIKQYPKVNGGNVIDLTGNVLALVGGFNFKISEFNRVIRLKDNLDLLLNQLFMPRLRKRFFAKYNNIRRPICCGLD